MRIALLVIAAACSTNSRTTQPDHARRQSEAGVSAPADATLSANAAISSADAAGPSKEVEDALHSLDSEHPSDVPAAAWWKAHASEVRPYLRAMLEDGTDDGQADRWAIRILGDIGDETDIAVLTTVQTTWKLETAREAAAAALAKLRKR